jgi:hypothetical protein
MIAVFAAINLASSDAPLYFAPFALTAWALIVVVLMRFGLLTLIVFFLTNALVLQLPLFADLSAWYSGRAFVPVAAFLALALYGFTTSLGGRSLFPAPARTFEA